jgi:uncharacterized lipoprotein YddW (UPF0748 family)
MQYFQDQTCVGGKKQFNIKLLRKFLMRIFLCGLFILSVANFTFADTKYEVKNASFENIVKGYPTGWFRSSGKGCGRVFMTNDAFSGKKAIAVNVNIPGKGKPFAMSGGWDPSTMIKAKPGTPVILTVMGKTPKEGVAQISVTFRKGKTWCGNISSDPIALTTKWQKFELKGNIPSGATHLQVNLTGIKGKTIFDDVKLEQKNWLKNVKASRKGEFWINVDYGDEVHYCKNLNYSTYREAEIATFFRQCRNNGVDGVLWRVSNLGQVMYKSKVCTVYPGRAPESELKKWQADLADIMKKMDPLAVAIKEARKNGIKIMVWVTISDEHSTSKSETLSVNNLLIDHPEYMLLDKNGKPMKGTLCYNVPEVRKYRLDMFRELVQYKADGIYLCTRTHAFYYGKDSGHQYGYNQPVIDEFKKRYGVNILKENFDKQKWLELRAEGLTIFMKDATAIVHGAKQKMWLGIKTTSNENRGWPYGNALLPWKGWVKKQWLDTVVVGQYYQPPGRIITDTKIFRKIAAPEQKILFWQQLWHYQKRIRTPLADLLKDIKLIAYAGADGAVYHEALNLEETVDSYWNPINKAIAQYWQKESLSVKKK